MNQMVYSALLTNISFTYYCYDYDETLSYLHKTNRTHFIVYILELAAENLL